MKLVAVLALLTLASAVFAAESAPTRDGSRILINKDVNGERWAITYDEPRGSVTGNVLLPGGGATFIDCDTQRSGSTLNLSCYDYGAAWRFLANVSLPVSFFGLSGGGQCSPDQVPNSYTFTVVYGDSCGLRGDATMAVEDQSSCTTSGALEQASEIALEGARFEFTIAADESVTARVEFRGACSGSATGTGRVTNNGNYDYRIDGRLTGSSTCCHDLTATFAITL